MALIILRRFLQAMVALFIVSVVVFGLARTTGNPVHLLVPISASPEQRAATTERLGLDKPLISQYGIYLQDLIRGDLGTSLRTGRPVSELVIPRLANSLKLGTATMALSLLVAIPLGVLGAVHRGGLWDRLATGVALVGQSVPPFWSGIVAILVFSVTLGWLPTSGIGGWQHYVLPVLTLSLFTSAGVVRLVRSSMLEELNSEYIVLAKIKGLRPLYVVWKHALRNALIPVVTFSGFMYGIIIAAALTTEVVFSWPGLGRLAFEAVGWRDFPVLQATVLIFAMIIIGINFIVDLIYLFLDPRMRV